jgi:La-related protein 7
MNLDVNENQELNESSTETEIKKSSKIKHVNKLLYKQIREQMEFYFSDSNLSKDRFINQEISKSEDGCKFPSK